DGGPRRVGDGVNSERRARDADASILADADADGQGAAVGLDAGVVLRVNAQQSAGVDGGRATDPGLGRVADGVDRAGTDALERQPDGPARGARLGAGDRDRVDLR